MSKTYEKYSPLDLARFMHETYERLAPSFGYETREDTREFDPDSPNGKLMASVMMELIVYLDGQDEQS